MTWEALMMGKVGVALEVAQQEGDPCCFELSPAIVDAFLEQGTVPGELGYFGVDEATLLLPATVADDLGVGFPVSQLVGHFCEGIEPSGPPGEELEEPCPHGVGGDA